MNESSRTANEIQAALDAGLLIAEPHELDDGSVFSVIVPEGARHELVRVPAPHPEHSPAPARGRGTYHPATVDAFVDVVDRHHDSDATTIWAHPTSGQIVAVLNDAASGQPAWRDHRVVLALIFTDEWKHWMSRNGALVNQQAFAEHIEDGLTEIAEPAGATVLELAQTFHAHTSASFRSGTRLQDGQVQLQYDEEVEASAGRKGEIKIPPGFKLVLAPFRGEDPLVLDARLRYRVREGNLTIGYKLDHPERVVQQSLEAIVNRLEEKFPSVYIGEPAGA